MRVFPLSNWTELDVWRYIELEGLELPSIYYAHERDVFERDGILLAVSEYAGPQSGETSAVEWVRYRTVGDLTITGAVRSRATEITGVIAEIPRPRSPSAARPAPTTAPRPPRWKTAT